MKKLIFIFLVLANSAWAKAMTLSELKSTAETFISVKEDEVVNAQRSYAVSNSGRYLQCHKFFTNPPIDGTATVPDRLDGPWNTLGVSFGLVQCSIEIHECQDNNGNGFLIYIYVRTLTNDIYRKIKAYNNAGKTNLDYLNQDWENITGII